MPSTKPGELTLSPITSENLIGRRCYSRINPTDTGTVRGAYVKMVGFEDRLMFMVELDSTNTIVISPSNMVAIVPIVEK